MPKAWAEVQQSPEFTALPPDQQEAARGQYFADVVAPQVKPADMETAKAQFDASTKTTMANISTGEISRPIERAPTLPATTFPDSLSMAGVLARNPIDSVGNFFHNAPKDAFIGAGKLAGATGESLINAVKGAWESLPNGVRDSIYEGSGAKGLKTINDYLTRGMQRVIPKSLQDWGSKEVQGAGNAIDSFKKSQPDLYLATRGLADMMAVAPVAKATATAVGSGARSALKNIPVSLYESGAKFATPGELAARDQVTQTLLDQKIPLTKTGYSTLENKITELNDGIAKAVGPVADTPVDPGRAVQWVQEAVKKANNSFDRGKNIAKIQETVANFIDDHPDLTIGKAQEIKKDIYRKLKNNYSAFQRTGAAMYSDGEVAAMKNIARGLKEEVAAQVPEVAGMNASESELLQAEPMLRRAVNRIGNHNILSLDDVMAATAGAAIGGPGAGAVVGAVKRFVGAPGPKSKLAIGLNSFVKGGKAAGPMTPVFPPWQEPLVPPAAPLVPVRGIKQFRKKQ